MKVNEIKGDLITLAENGMFDVIAQGNNCFCAQKSGLAPQMVKAFNTDTFPLEDEDRLGDINKLGQIDFQHFYVATLTLPEPKKLETLNGLEMTKLVVVNCYTQYGTKRLDNQTPIDYEALTLCLRKINSIFKGKHVGLPFIGAGLAGGDWTRIKQIILDELMDCEITIVEYGKN